MESLDAKNNNTPLTPTAPRQKGLIINSAFEKPTRYWPHEKDEILNEEPRLGRRPAEYIKITEAEGFLKAERVKIELVDAIRSKVEVWRDQGFPGVTVTTRTLLDHWRDKDARTRAFFFCQLDAIETLIWLKEGPAQERNKIVIKGDGGSFERLCTKLCTGGGKTVVMAMLIAYLTCNKAANPQDKRFFSQFLVVAPNLTVRDRLIALKPGEKNNCYDEFEIVPPALKIRLASALVTVINWQTLYWEDAESLKKKKSVKKTGPLSDKAFTKSILPNYKGALVVLNDEAHHAWRITGESGLKGKKADVDENEATVWINGLDKINNVLSIKCCYDFSATPYVPLGKNNKNESLFPWIVSDFSLNDGIESGIVKTPRIVKDRSNVSGSDYNSKLFHIYADKDTKDNLNSKSGPEIDLPKLVIDGYRLLTLDYEETRKEWENVHSPVPPVMISVCNRTDTAARVVHSFIKKKIGESEALQDESTTLHIDSDVLNSDKKDEENLRKKINTVGQQGEPGEKICHVVSVAMLSEGWDAKTVTHIMGLRAFSSQLLCEQVVGRGLRRTSYDLNKDGLFDPEYVNIFGIPFAFLPHEEDDGGGNGVEHRPPKPTTKISCKTNAPELEITWPNVVRIDERLDSYLLPKDSEIPPLTLDPAGIILSVELQGVVDGVTHLSDLKIIDLEKIKDKYRTQALAFRAAAAMYNKLPSIWKESCSHSKLVADLVTLVQGLIKTGKVNIEWDLFSDQKYKDIILYICCPKIIDYILHYIDIKSKKEVTATVDSARPLLSTSDMTPWWTTRPVIQTKKSQITGCVCDSTWEKNAAYALDNCECVTSWVKNDHLGFIITYEKNSALHRYIPDFLVRLNNDTMLVLETKGVNNDDAKVKMRALEDWTNAITLDGRWGQWTCKMSHNPNDINGICRELAAKPNNKNH